MAATAIRGPRTANAGVGGSSHCQAEGGELGSRIDPTAISSRTTTAGDGTGMGLAVCSAIAIPTTCGGMGGGAGQRLATGTAARELYALADGMDVRAGPR
jgi:ferric-dicitrate binding protein FerR (iron transport regulator)